ncbi:retinol-binding protein pinta-like [Photinus pyralis]|uniref:CRAL-TRIO domain-containing protein n=1 Tax=Photinus pyralis TaxID=7054 RepID=A0A1Y1KXG2_PHOPY|nr:retinol-binding protein pinta-like [Photinus pyralis]
MDASEINNMKCCKETDLNEDPKIIGNDLQMIRDWLRKQPHLKVREDDASLLIFLRSSKYSIQRAKEKLDNYYSMVTLLPEFFANRDPFAPDIQELLRVGTMVPLPNTIGDCGPRIILFAFDYDADLVPYTTLIKACLMLLDILMVEDLNTVVSGVYLLSDPAKCALNYILQFTPSYISKHVYCMETGYPLRLKGIQVENCPAAMEAAVRFLRNYLNGKISKRLHVYSADSNPNGLKKEIPLELMPIEYGGKNGSMKELGVIWKKKMESYSEWFRDGTKYKTNESLRTGMPKTTDNELGIDGSFRKLVID